jgi:hypothetical protein
MSLRNFSIYLQDYAVLIACLTSYLRGGNASPCNCVGFICSFLFSSAFRNVTLSLGIENGLVSRFIRVSFSLELHGGPY